MPGIDLMASKFQQIRTERESARAVAVRLEQENAHQAQIIANQIAQIADLGGQVADQHDLIRDLKRTNGIAYRAGIERAMAEVDRGGRAEQQLQVLLAEVTP
jgi:hypothetical protein